MGPFDITYSHRSPIRLPYCSKRLMMIIVATEFFQILFYSTVFVILSHSHSTDIIYFILFHNCAFIQVLHIIQKKYKILYKCNFIVFTWYSFPNVSQLLTNKSIQLWLSISVFPSFTFYFNWWKMFLFCTVPTVAYKLM